MSLITSVVPSLVASTVVVSNFLSVVTTFTGAVVCFPSSAPMKVALAPSILMTILAGLQLHVAGFRRR